MQTHTAAAEAHEAAAKAHDERAEQAREAGDEAREHDATEAAKAHRKAAQAHRTGQRDEQAERDAETHAEGDEDATDEAAAEATRQANEASQNTPGPDSAAARATAFLAFSFDQETPATRHRTEEAARKAAWRAARSGTDRSAWPDLDEAHAEPGVRLASVGLEGEALTGWCEDTDAAKAALLVAWSLAFDERGVLAFVG